MVHVRFEIITILIAGGLFIGMLLTIEFGRRWGIRQIAARGTAARTGVGVVDSAVYSLFALLLGFSFSGAAGRFEHRREMIADVANNAGTAWQRIDMLPIAQQAAVRVELRRYVDVLIAWYAEAPSVARMMHFPDDLTKTQNSLWSASVAACLAPDGEKARMLLLPGLNDMYSSVEKELMARRMHPPALIWAMLGITALAGGLFAGYGLASGTKRNWIYVIGISASVAVSIYVIMELEYPRLGLARVNDIDQALVEVRATMGDGGRGPVDGGR